MQEVEYYSSARVNDDHSSITRSVISVPIATIPSQPGKPVATNVTHDSIQLEWTKPEQGAHNINSYTILYRLVSDSKPGKPELHAWLNMIVFKCSGQSQNEVLILNITSYTVDVIYHFEFISDSSVIWSECNAYMNEEVLLMQLSENTAYCFKVRQDQSVKQALD